MVFSRNLTCWSAIVIAVRTGLCVQAFVAVGAVGFVCSSRIPGRQDWYCRRGRRYRGFVCFCFTRLVESSFAGSLVGGLFSRFTVCTGSVCSETLYWT